MTRTCNKCGGNKPLSNFPLNSTKAGGGRKGICRKCTRSRRKSAGRCECNKPLVNATRCETCYKRHLDNSKERRLREKTETIEHYGGKCVFCGQNKLVFLTIDHKNNDGAKHRKEIKGLSATIYSWLRKNHFPDQFQVACFNCNIAKSMIGEDELIKLLNHQS